MFRHIAYFCYRNTLKFLTLICIGLFSLVDVYAASGEYYIFYRGHHILSNAAYDPTILDARGIMTRPISNGVIAGDDITANVERMASLNREWTVEEKAVFKPTCHTPYQELVQQYTNSYSTFTAELRDPMSRTRKILNLAGVDVADNFFVSTSLKSSQAYRYGAGLKLFDHEELRRYPAYNETYQPANATIGYVDVICVPKEKIAQLFPFFVVESFTTGDTKLSYHFSKNLTEEMEVIFPFWIEPKDHLARFPIILPSLSKGVVDRLNHTHWKKALSEANSEDAKKKVELKLIEAWVSKRAEDLEEMVKGYFKENKLTRISTSPQFKSYGTALVPADGVLMRKQIIATTNIIQMLGYDPIEQAYRFPISETNFILCHAIRHITGNGYPVSITFSFSMKDLNPEMVGIFLTEASLKEIKFAGDKKRTKLIQEVVRDYVGYGLGIRRKPKYVPIEDSYLLLNDENIRQFCMKLTARKAKLRIDVSGLGLFPTYTEKLMDISKVDLVDTVMDEEFRKQNKEMLRLIMESSPEEEDSLETNSDGSSSEVSASLSDFAEDFE